MSNKPFKLRPKGASILKDAQQGDTLQRQRGSPIKKRAPILATLRGKRAAAQMGLLALLLVLCGFYVSGLNNESTTVLAVKRELPVYCVERSDDVVAISFDASWGGDKTIPILDLLDKYKVKTTFFLVGQWVEKYPDLVREIDKRGHEIGNHSDSHPHMNKLSESQIITELDKMNDRVEALIGKRPTLFRAPYGEYNDRVVKTARAQGFEVVQWSIDSLDWKDRGTKDIITQCTHRVDKGDIVLFHNDSKDAVNALPTVIEHYQGLGYKIIPISEILLEGNTNIDVQGKQHPAAS